MAQPKQNIRRLLIAWVLTSCLKWNVIRLVTLTRHRNIPDKRPSWPMRWLAWILLSWKWKDSERVASRLVLVTNLGFDGWSDGFHVMSSSLSSPRKSIRVGWWSWNGWLRRELGQRCESPAQKSQQQTEQSAGGGAATASVTVLCFGFWHREFFQIPCFWFQNPPVLYEIGDEESIGSV